MQCLCLMLKVLLNFIDAFYIYFVKFKVFDCDFIVFTLEISLFSLKDRKVFNAELF